MQRFVHRNVIGTALSGNVDRVPLLQRIPARMLGLEIRREHIRSPTA